SQVWLYLHRMASVGVAGGGAWRVRKSVILGSPLFFQAEDGIRAATVTGVETCALPIFIQEAFRQAARFHGQPLDEKMRIRIDKRSEERRVGKEYRPRGSPQHQKKPRTQEGQCNTGSWRRSRATDSRVSVQATSAKRPLE